MYRSLDIPCTSVDTCISGLTASFLNFWVISTCITIDKVFLEFTEQNTWHTTLFYSAISRISGLFFTCYHIAYFRGSSPIKVANMTLCLLRSRDVKVMKSMLSCREFICAQSHKNFYLISSDKKCTQQRVLWGYFPPFATCGLTWYGDHITEAYVSIRRT